MPDLGMETLPMPRPALRGSSPLLAGTAWSFCRTFSFRLPHVIFAPIRFAKSPFVAHDMSCAGGAGPSTARLDGSALLGYFTRGVHRTLRKQIRLGVVGAALSLVGWTSAWDGGPLYDSFELTLREGRRTEVLGPLLSWEREPEREGWALHPLLSTECYPAMDRRSVDVLYPLFTYDRVGPESRWQLFQLLSGSHGADQQERRTERFTLFPVVFWERSEDPDRRTFAVLPFYGHLERRLFRDEIDVVLFPLWSRTRKRDVVTENWLYPFVHVRQGEGLVGWQLWPVYGYEKKEVTWRTNFWGEEVRVPGHVKRFVAWPFFVEHQTGQGSDRPMHQTAFVPFYASSRSSEHQSTSWGWPLGVTVSTNAKTGYHEVGAPWPFVVWGQGPGRTTCRLWPLYGLTHTPHRQSRFFLWPLWQSRRNELSDLTRHDRRVALFVYRELREDFRDGSRRSRHDLWPLGTYRRDSDGQSRLQLFAPVEPILPGNRGVERNYSPIWSVWRVEQDPGSGRSSHSLLWNLFRYERRPDAQKASLLFGVVRYECKGPGWRFQFLGLPLKGQRSGEPGAGPGRNHAGGHLSTGPKPD